MTLYKQITLEFMPLAIELGLSSNIYTQIIQNNLINDKRQLQPKNTLATNTYEEFGYHAYSHWCQR